ncbi:putative FY-rich, FY-rich, WD40/YVTN repeat-like-containing domain protein, partial [Tanacetum coccineum]
DLRRRIIVSKFSAPGTSYQPFLPINLYRFPSQAFSTTGACTKKQVADIMEETQKWSLETNNHASFPVKEDDLSLVLLMPSVSNLDLLDKDPYKDSGVSPVGCWSLALLAKSKLVSKNALDPSATVAGASAGYGIIGTSDGSLYIWELATGTKLGYLSNCRGATMSCLTADDSDSGAFAVAVDGSQLQVYAPGTSADRKHT